MQLPDLDPLIHQRTRLRIMTLLFRNREAPMTWVREQLGLTFGNLDSHAAKLEQAGYIDRGRRLAPGGFEVRLQITEQGRQAFSTYTASLQAYLDAEQPTHASPPSESGG